MSSHPAARLFPRLSIILKARPVTPQNRSLDTRFPIRHSPTRSFSSKAEDASKPNESLTASSNALSDALTQTKTEDNNLLSPVHIPEDPDGVLNEKHPAMGILGNSAIVVQRQLEMMNLMMGFEEANRYVIMDPRGNHIGYMAEREFGMGNMLARQTFKTHRSFTTHVFNKEGVEVLRFHRPFAYISSRIRVYDPLEVGAGSHSTSTGLQTSTPGALTTSIDPNQMQISPLDLSQMRIIGEAQQQWAFLRRKYNLFLFRDSASGELDSPQLTSGELPLSNSTQLQVSTGTSDPANGQYNQFAYVDEPFLSWDFTLLSQDSKLIGSVNRNFAGFGREIFTDTGVYALRMDAAGLAEEPQHIISKTGERNPSLYGEEKAGMTLDQRAVMLATAVSVDFDYFSRRRSGVMGMMPLWFPIGGDAVGAEAGAAGVGAAAGEGEVGGVGGAAAGAGTIAGYDAMQRGRSASTDGNEEGDSVPSAADDSNVETGQGPPSDTLPPQDEDVWGEEGDWNPWGQNSGKSDGNGGGSGSGSDGGGGGDWGDFDWF